MVQLRYDILLIVSDIPESEVEASGHITSERVEYSLQDQQESATVCTKKDSVEDSSSLSNEAADHEQEPPYAVGEPQQFTHASIVCAFVITATFNQLLSFLMPLLDHSLSD